MLIFQAPSCACAILYAFSISAALQEQNFSEAVEAVNHSQEEDIYISRIRRRHITMGTVPLARQYDFYLNYWDASLCYQLPLR